MAQQPPQQPPVAHWRDIIRRKNTHLLFSEDLGPPGTKVDVEIIDATKATVTGEDGKSEDKVALTFKGGDGKPRVKKLAIGARMSKVLETMFGTSNYHHWRGWVTLVVVRTTIFDQKLKQNIETDAIRIAPEPPKRGASNSKQRDTKPAAESSTTMSEDEKREIEQREREEAGRG